MQALPRLQALLARLRRRARTRAVLGGGAVLATAALMAAVLSFGLDYLLELDRIGRVLVSLAIVVTLAAIAWRRLRRPLRAPLSDVALASLIERRDPSLESKLSSAIDFASRSAAASGELSAAFEQEVIAAAEVEATTRPGLGADLIVPGLVARRGGAIALVIVVACGLFMASGELGRIWLARNLLLASVEWPRDTRLTLLGAEDGEIRVAHGDPVTIRVRAEGVLPASAWLDAEFEDGSRLHTEMVEEEPSGTFAISIESITSAAVFEVSSRRSWPATGALMVVARPVLRELTASIEFPAYLDRDGAQIEDPSALELPEGSVLHLSGRCDKALDRVRLSLAGVEAPLTIEAVSAFRGSIAPTSSGALLLDVVDSDGLSPTTPVRIEIELAADQAPVVELKPIGVGALVTSRAAIRYRIVASDDHGMKSAALVLSTGTPEEPSISRREIAGHAGTSEHSGVLEVEELQLQPGQSLQVVAEATDHCDLLDHPVGRSESFTFKIVTEEELLTELIRVQMELRRELERAVADQTRLVTDLGSLQAGDETATDRAENASRLERLERSIARRAEGIAAQSRQVLAELETSRLAEDGDRHRIVDSIAVPLEAVSAGELAGAATELAEADRRIRAQDAAAATIALQRASRAADNALEVMRSVLEAMLKQETFGEILSILKEVIRLHGDAGTQAEDERRRRILDVLEQEGDR